MPKLVVKLLLKIYTDENDEDKKYKSPDEIFSPIIDILISNTAMTIDDESSLIQNLRKYIIPYYQELMGLLIPKIKVLIDNYNRYLMNEQRHIDVLMVLIDKAIEENK